MILFWFLASIAASLGAYAILVSLKISKWEEASRRDMVKLAVAGVVVAIVLWAAPLYYEFPMQGDVISFEGNTIKHHPWGKFCWEFGDGYANVRTHPIIIGGGLTLLTDNPKVRKFNYDLQVRITSMEKFYLRPEGRLLRNSGDTTGSYNMHGVYPDRVYDADEAMAKVVSYELYRFNSTYSKQLANFDNPLDAQQRQDLKVLIESALNPELDKVGLAVEFQRFTID